MYFVLTKLNIRVLIIPNIIEGIINYIEDYDKLDIPICASKYISKFLDNSTLNLSCWQKPKKYKVNNLFPLEDRDLLDLDEIKIECYATPGHSQDGMCYLIDNKFLFSGLRKRILTRFLAFVKGI